ncbi:hypothetical protein [Haloarcula sp. Atlit-120R]|uniref:hypothetical protein n=1 Tax=Haloarcula sp. Atlit-120R TaxID=2282135 RepID=UPI000EF192E9|nr:hypothetical protein [Haloarcula sp. Atlit-120R]RLM32928.1 hypothetical protein DVK01_18565 [Haloarcula sp. Atlit-120R]
MSSHEIDQVEQLRRLGIGLVVGGIAFGGLSFLTSTSVSGVGLFVVGLAVWGLEYQRDRTVGIGLGIGFTGVVLLLNVVGNIGFSELSLAATLVGVGIADYLLAPAYGKLQDTGEQMSE